VRVHLGAIIVANYQVNKHVFLVLLMGIPFGIQQNCFELDRGEFGLRKVRYDLVVTSEQSTSDDSE